MQKIKITIVPTDLHYVKSAENPADPASRGLTSAQLLKCSLWFNGTDCLKDDILPITPQYIKEEGEPVEVFSHVSEINLKSNIIE